MTTKPYDVVVFGATSFVGQILARYLIEEFGLDGKLHWAAAGRSLPKLEALRKSLGKGAGKLTLLQADAADEASLQQLCRSARVIVSTVGPYALYGEPLVRVCAETGTDYCDLTGEVQWMRRMIHQYEKTAQASGARIVHNCGFDSIPSDLGVHYLQQQARVRFGQPCTTVKMRVRSMRGGFSGGTVASLLNVLKEVKANPALRKELADPYSICPAGSGKRVRQANVGFAEYDADFNAWIAPFVMSAINTRVVHRTNALLHDAYGPEFRYDEAVLTGRGLRGRLTATATGAGLGAFMVAGSIGTVRTLLEKHVLPAPGEGPSPEEQLKGGFDLRFFGRTKQGDVLRTRVTGDRDPGYGSTARMLGQAAACLAGDIPRESVAGGFWTPAAIFGDRIVERLQTHAGLTFEVLDR
ncbi:MAG: saccharopine dehydrogenase NADP-binding domain-containing protein [Steroidobacteraceae bacterium]